MNVDDLHDPSPPRADAATFAAVATRARTLRRRRAVLSTIGGALAVAVVAVPVGLALREQQPDRIAPATLPSVDPTPSTTSAPSSSPPLPTAAPDVGAPLVTAVTDQGAAVVVGADGTTTALEVGDPALPAGVQVQVVLMAPSGRAFVGTCCVDAAAPGSTGGDPFRWGELLPGELDRPGQLRSIDAAASALAVVLDGGVVLTDLDGVETAGARPDGPSTVVDVAFLPDGRVAVIDLHTEADGGSVGRLHVSDDRLSTLPASSGTVLGPVEGNGTWRLAGTDATGNVLVVAGGDGVFEGRARAFDPGTLAEADASVTIADPVRDVWVDGGRATVVDADGTLRLDGAVISQGRYRSARPVGSGSSEAPTAPATTSSTSPSGDATTTAAASAPSVPAFTALRSSEGREGDQSSRRPSTVVMPSTRSSAARSTSPRRWRSRACWNTPSTSA